MTVLSAKSLKQIKPVEPFFEDKQIFNGMSYGLSIAGYDIRSKQKVRLAAGDFTLLSSLERFKMPKDVIGFVHDKSTWARQGLAVQNTVIEPGWEGFLTLEISNHNRRDFSHFYDEDTGWNFEEAYRYITIEEGSPIAQIVFHWVDDDSKGYTGKYQNQEDRPVEARFER